STGRPTAVVITGASSGIGRATALLMAGEGLHVVLTGRAPDVLEEVAERCRARGGTASVVQLDVRDAEAVRRVIAQAADEFGPGLAVVHSAAVVAYGNVEEVPSEVMTQVVNTNVFGTLAVCRAAMDAFRRTGAGHLVVVGSLLGEIATPYMGSYVLSKWAVHGLVRTLQIETRQRDGVEVSLIAPGGIDTPIYQQAATVLGRHGTPPPPVLQPEDVARRVWWVLRHPRRQINVGPVNLVVIAGFRLFPAVYDAVVTPLMRTFGLDAWRGLPPTPGNVDQPQHPPHDATPAGHDPDRKEDDMSEDQALSRPRVSRQVAAPAEAVWAVLADGWQYATWVVGASRVRAVDVGWPATGTRLHHSFGPWPAVISDATVSEQCDEAHHLVLRAKGWPVGEARVEIELVPDGPGSCTVSIAEDAVKGPGTIVPMPVRQVMILPRNREALRRLAYIAEGRHRQWLAGSDD
ncbi:MAG TPA: SDR family NAD(P)-dependent oxidoreductase, partial [Ornithinibacter sp.]|nr:SDR family NAD(P)-dependent oxidoreductase [Ornithinibacter sp.]